MRRWVAAKGWELLLNRKGTSWRGLDKSVKSSVVDAESARAVMLANASTINRPVVTRGDAIIVGVDFEALAALSRMDVAQSDRSTCPSASTAK